MPEDCSQYELRPNWQGHPFVPVPSTKSGLPFLGVSGLEYCPQTLSPRGVRGGQGEVGEAAPVPAAAGSTRLV